MKTVYDADADTLYIRFAESIVADSRQVAVGVVLNLDPYGRIVAIELHDASEHVALGTDLNALR
jgi:uncharacterized protein YuzE